MVLVLLLPCYSGGEERLEGLERERRGQEEEEEAWKEEVGGEEGGGRTWRRRTMPGQTERDSSGERETDFVLIIILQCSYSLPFLPHPVPCGRWVDPTWEEGCGPLPPPAFSLKLTIPWCFVPSSCIPIDNQLLLCGGEGLVPCVPVEPLVCLLCVVFFFFFLEGEDWGLFPEERRMMDLEEAPFFATPPPPLVCVLVVFPPFVQCVLTHIIILILLYL